MEKPTFRQLPLSTKGIVATVLISVILFTGILTGAWYVFYWKKTPAYSLNLIRTAVETHNVAEFEKHVDVESLAGHAFDDLVSSTLDGKKDSSGANTVARGLVQMIRQPFINLAKDAGKRLVETGSLANAPAADGASEAKSRFSAAEVSKNTGLSSSTFKGIAYSKEDGNRATVGITVFDKQLEKELVVELAMIQLDDGSWKVTEIANLKDYMAQLKKLRGSKLALLNAPLEAKLKKAIQPGAISANVVAGDRWGFSRELVVAIPVTVGAAAKPTAFSGQLAVKNKNGDTLLQSGIKAGADDISSANPVLRYEFHLNQFMDGHNEILASNPNNLSYTVTVSSVTFADGNEIKLLDALPES